MQSIASTVRSTGALTLRWKYSPDGFGIVAVGKLRGMRWMFRQFSSSFSTPSGNRRKRGNLEEHQVVNEDNLEPKHEELK